MLQCTVALSTYRLKIRPLDIDFFIPTSCDQNLIAKQIMCDFPSSCLLEVFKRVSDRNGSPGISLPVIDKPT